MDTPHALAESEPGPFCPQTPEATSRAAGAGPPLHMPQDGSSAPEGRVQEQNCGTGPAARRLSGSGLEEDFLCGGLSQGTGRARDSPCRAEAVYSPLQLLPRLPSPFKPCR